MSKKHYNRIAKEYAALWHDPEFKYYTTAHMFKRLVSQLADVLIQDNAAFDRERFMSAIYGVKGGK